MNTSEHYYGYKFNPSINFGLRHAANVIPVESAGS
jgi:hypothetical protein